MKRFMYYPICKYDILDKKLAGMEASGYRLDRVSPFWIFHFKPCKPRQVQYMTTYTYTKEFDRCGYNLLTQCEANEINGNPISVSGLVSIYRITKENLDMSEIISERNNYLRRASWKKIPINLLLLIATLIGPIFNNPPEVDSYTIFLSIINAIINVFSLLCLVWNIVNLIVLNIKKKVEI